MLARNKERASLSAWDLPQPFARPPPRVGDRYEDMEPICAQGK